ncbi:MAG: hypothetical protein NZ519_07155 [Bacteroidia bacterium]|nr:hypothetical protein [Bacteroidia bacterium]
MNTPSIPKIWLLVAVWVVSVGLRIPFLNRPLSIHHEWMLAHLLITLEIWESKSISASKYALIYTYPYDKTNAHLDFIGGIKDKEGNYYYVSYPPFAFYAAYIFCKVFFLPIAPLSIQLFNLIWHFVCAFFWYKILRIVFNSEKWAFWGYVLYLFLPFNLWYHGNTYFVDIFVQGLWAGYLYFWLMLYLEKRTIRNYLGLFIFSLLLMYTEWIAVFIGIATLIVGILIVVKKRSFLHLLPVCVAGTGMLIGLALTLYQYAHIQDWQTLKQTLFNKYEFRSGKKELQEQNTSLYWFMLIYHYIKGYAPLLVLMAIGIFYLLRKHYRKNLWISFNKLIWLILLGLPVVLHHSVLFGFTYFHEFSVLKTSFILIALSLWFMRMLNFNKTIYILLILIQVGMYYAAFYRYTDAYQKIGQTIKKERQANELVVLAVTEDFWAVPQIMYYAKCNFYYEEEQLRNLPAFLNRYNLKKYVVFYVEKDHILSIKHFER